MVHREQQPNNDIIQNPAEFLGLEWAEQVSSIIQEPSIISTIARAPDISAASKREFLENTLPVIFSTIHDTDGTQTVCDAIINQLHDISHDSELPLLVTISADVMHAFVCGHSEVRDSYLSPPDPDWMPTELHNYYITIYSPKGIMLAPKTEETTPLFSQYRTSDPFSPGYDTRTISSDQYDPSVVNKLQERISQQFNQTVTEQELILTSRQTTANPDVLALLNNSTKADLLQHLHIQYEWYESLTLPELYQLLQLASKITLKETAQYQSFFSHNGINGLRILLLHNEHPELFATQSTTSFLSYFLRGDQERNRLLALFALAVPLLNQVYTIESDLVTLGINSELKYSTIQSIRQAIIGRIANNLKEALDGSYDETLNKLYQPETSLLLSTIQGVCRSGEYGILAELRSIDLSRTSADTLNDTERAEYRTLYEQNLAKDSNLNKPFQRLLDEFDQRIVQPTTTVYTITLQGALAGYILFAPQPDGTVHMQALNIAPELQGNRLGEYVITSTITREMDSHTITGMCTPSDPSSARYIECGTIGTRFIPGLNGLELRGDQQTNKNLVSRSMTPQELEQKTLRNDNMICVSSATLDGFDYGPLESGYLLSRRFKSRESNQWITVFEKPAQ